jgi:hypothetical protein
MVGWLASEAVPILGEHHRNATSGHQVPNSVHTRPLQARTALARVLYLLEDLVALPCGILPQCFKLLGEGEAAPCLLVGGDAGVEDGPLGAVGARHYLLLSLGQYFVHLSLWVVCLS